MGQLECLCAWLQLHFHGPLSMNTRLWLTGGKWVTHPVLGWGSFNAFYNGVVMTCLQILLGWLLAHAVQGPNVSIHFSSYFTFSCLVWAMCPQLWPFEKSLNFGNWPCCPESCGLAVDQCWEGCVEGELWWNARVCIKTSSEAVILRFC